MSGTDNLAHDGSPVPFRPQEVVELGMDMMKGFSRVEALIHQLGTKTGERFDGVDQRFDGIDQRLDHMDQRFDGIDQRFDGIDQRLDHMDQRFDQVTRDLAQVTGAVEAAREKMGQLNLTFWGFKNDMLGVRGELGQVKHGLTEITKARADDANRLSRLEDGQASQLAILEEIRGKLN